ncbi:hypothetical protein ALQ78_04649 [Pseudomonas syringae pv. aptata]|nr:hypothetical protein ALQ78_04649 [Pseudomonas syringae pv. aptata]
MQKVKTRMCMEAHSERWKSLVIMSVLSHRQVMRARIVRTPFIWRTYMPSFDVVSELDKHEVTNAVDNAIKELDRRYDLKGKGTFEFKELTVTLTAEADFQLEAMIEILKLALVKRKIDAKCLEIKDAYASGKLMKQEVILREGIDKELAKKIVAHIKEAKLKVQAAIQGEQVRVTGKKRDDLQEAIAALRAYDSGMPLQFNNFRD